MATLQFDELDIYRAMEDAADRIWETVVRWDQFARNTVARSWCERRIVWERTSQKAVAGRVSRTISGS